jgi:hypothetical protein
MSVAAAAPAFLTGALISLATSWLLVSRLERVGKRTRCETAWYHAAALQPAGRAALGALAVAVRARSRSRS